MNKWLQGMKRKAKVTDNEEINDVVLEWFMNVRSETFRNPVKWSKVKLSQ
jgi:hypothetical protein